MASYPLRLPLMAKDKPPPYFKVIHEDFAAHLAFRQERKLLKSDELVFARQRNFQDFSGNVEVCTALLTGNCIWSATKSAKARISYRLRLNADDYGEVPCFRFDSCGLAHRNDIGTLTEQKIMTPHFHRVDSDGIMRAYQTPELADPVQGVEIASDPQLGVNLFCQELNLAAPSGRNVVLKTFATEMGWSTTNPLRGAKFPRTT